MLTKQKTYETLICLTILCFGFFGSLSHVFSLSLIILFFANLNMSKKRDESEYNAKLIFVALSACFALFFILGIARSNFGSHLHALSPMLPIPLIGLLILFHSNTGFKLSARCVAKFSQISVLFSLILCLFLTTFTEPNSQYYIYNAGRLVLFSGNPIPFSFVTLGLSIFCLSNWKNSEIVSKIIAFSCFVVGAYFAGVLSGTRGTLLALGIITPLIIYYLSNRPLFTVLATLIMTASIPFSAYFGLFDILGKGYVDHIRRGLETLLFAGNSESSVWQRLEMWSAAIKAISNAPILGYGVAERFDAIKPFLKENFQFYSHPHNDIFASIISIGIFGGFFGLISIFSAVLASQLTPYLSPCKTLLSVMLTISTLVTASVSTVFFHDITSAWLAFSTYLIWATNFEGTNPPNSTQRPYF